MKFNLIFCEKYVCNCTVHREEKERTKWKASLAFLPFGSKTIHPIFFVGDGNDLALAACTAFPLYTEVCSCVFLLGLLLLLSFFSRRIHFKRMKFHIDLVYVNAHVYAFCSRMQRHKGQFACKAPTGEVVSASSTWESKQCQSQNDTPKEAVWVPVESSVVVVIIFVVENSISRNGEMVPNWWEMDWVSYYIINFSPRASSWDAKRILSNDLLE